MSDLGEFARLIKGSERGPQFPAAGLVRLPGVPSSEMMVVPSSVAEAVRLMRGGADRKVPAGASTRSPSSSNTAWPRSTRKAWSAVGSSCSLITRSPAAWAVQAVTPKAVMPRRCRIGRSRQQVLEFLDLVQMRNRVVSHRSPPSLPSAGPAKPNICKATWAGFGV